MRPNFLFIITDQHRADHLGCYGNSIVRTPHIDGLAARGWRSNRFYVANPACMPNRSTLMTGRMPSVHKVRSNGIPLSLRATTFVDLMRHGGYATASCGKIHLQPMMGQAPLLRAAETGGRTPPPAQLGDACMRDPGDGPYDQERIDKWQGDPAHDLKLPYYGFEEVHLTMMHADGAHGHYGRWLEARHPGSASLIGREHALPSGSISTIQAWRTAVPEELYSTNYIRDQAVGFLERHASGAGGKPFFLQCSFNDPHHPFTPPGRYWDMYDPDDIPLPAAFDPDEQNLPPPVKFLIGERDSGRQDRDSWLPQAVNARDVREAIALTYGSITMIDDAIGSVLATLQRLGLLENTVVIFTSDHGDYMGDHQLMLKGPIHYDGLIRVPFIWADPAAAQAGASSDALAGTLDIAATILGRAGLAPFHGMQGQDLAPVIAGGQTARQAMLVEEDNQRAFLGFDRPVRLRTLITERYRMSVYRGVAWGELYDLREDPLERRNLWSDPASAPLRAELMEQLVQTMQELADDSPLPTARA